MVHEYVYVASLTWLNTWFMYRPCSDQSTLHAARCMAHNNPISLALPPHNSALCPPSIGASLQQVALSTGRAEHSASPRPVLTSCLCPPLIGASPQQVALSNRSPETRPHLRPVAPSSRRLTATGSRQALRIPVTHSHLRPAPFPSAPHRNRSRRALRDPATRPYLRPVPRSHRRINATGRAEHSASPRRYLTVTGPSRA